ncbi:MAG: hypothetical protein AAF530_24190 [Pseudomonadota bacterium]
MANAFIGAPNLFDFADGVTAGSQVPTLPVQHLVDPRVVKPWRSDVGVTATHLVADNGSPKTLRAMALLGTNLTGAATFQVRISSSDETGVTGDIYDSGTIAAGQVDPAYGAFVHALPTEVTGRYVRLDMSDPSLSYLQAGRWFFGATFQPGINIQFGLKRDQLDPSRLTESLDGQVFIDRREKRRAWRINFDFLTEQEALTGLSEIDRLVSITEDVLFVLDPESDNLGRDSIWGLLSQPSGLTHSNQDTFQQSYTITERK